MGGGPAQGDYRVVYLKLPSPTAREAPDLPIRKQETVVRNSPGMRNELRQRRPPVSGDTTFSHQARTQEHNMDCAWSDDPCKRRRTVR